MKAVRFLTQWMTRAAVVGGLALSLAGTTASVRAAAPDPLTSGPRVAVPNVTATWNFEVNVGSGPLLFPASITNHHGALSGTMTSVTGCPGTINAGSTDTSGHLTMTVTFGGACGGEPATFAGTLRFGKGHGHGTFTDPFVSGTYAATKV